MKNFRKVLALVLVVATLLSFATMASAVEYVDADEINYEAAVDVLSAIGILNGYKTGDEYTFKPGDDIEREEAAKMIAVLHNAGTDIGDLYASACTFADAKDSWAASYIAYCNQTGIIAGHNASTFAPNDSITGYQLAKMLLVTLGFNPEIQGYVGANWKVNVLTDAKNFGLLKGFSAKYDISKAITREEAAMMMFNTLQAPLVLGSVSENLVTVSNAWYIDFEGFKPTLTLADALKKGFTVVYGNTLISTKPLGAIYKGLTVDMFDVYDCFGRPGTVWSYNVKGSSWSKFYADSADYTFTTASDLEKLLKVEKNYAFTVYEDGVRTENVPYTSLNATVADGKGVVTEVYVDDLAETVTIVVINTYIGKVARVMPFAKTFEIVRYDADGNVAQSFGTFDNTYGFVGGEYILFNICNGLGMHDDDFRAANDFNSAAVSGYLHNAKVVKPTTVTVSDSFWALDGSLAKSNFTADGKVYEYAEMFDFFSLEKDATDDNKTVTENKTKQKINVYLDDNGYVMLWKDYTATPDKFVGYFIEDTMTFVEDDDFGYVSGSWTRDDEHFADVMDFTPAKSNIRIGWNENKAETDAGLLSIGKKIEAWTNYAGVLAQYTVDANGVARAVKYGTWLEEGGKVETVSGKIYDDKGAVAIWGNNDTKYMIRTFDFASGEYKYDVLTGHKALENEYIAEIWFNDNVNDTYVEVASLQYLDLDKDNIAEYVFLDAAFVATSETIFVLEQTGWGSCADLIPANVKHQIPGFAVYSALVGGKVATVLAADHDLDATTNTALTKGMYTAKAVALGAKDHDGNPIYVAFEEVPFNLTWTDVEKVYGGQLYINALDTDEKYENIANDALIVLLFDGSFDFDGDGVKDKYAVFNGVEAFNASAYNAVEFSCGAAWAKRASAKADITELFVEVSLVSA